MVNCHTLLDGNVRKKSKQSRHSNNAHAWAVVLSPPFLKKKKKKKRKKRKAKNEQAKYKLQKQWGGQYQTNGGAVSSFLYIAFFMIQLRLSFRSRHFKGRYTGKRKSMRKSSDLNKGNLSRVSTFAPRDQFVRRQYVCETAELGVGWEGGLLGRQITGMTPCHTQQNFAVGGSFTQLDCFRVAPHSANSSARSWQTSSFRQKGTPHETAWSKTAQIFSSATPWNESFSVTTWNTASVVQTKHKATEQFNLSEIWLHEKRSHRKVFWDEISDSIDWLIQRHLTGRKKTNNPLQHIDKSKRELAGTFNSFITTEQLRSLFIFGSVQDRPIGQCSVQEVTTTLAQDNGITDAVATHCTRLPSSFHSTDVHPLYFLTPVHPNQALVYPTAFSKIFHLKKLWHFMQTHSFLHVLGRQEKWRPMTNVITERD